MDYEALETALAAAINPDSDLYKEAVEKAEQRRTELARFLFNHDLAKPVVSVLDEQPEFEKGYMVNLDNGASGFHASEVAVKLVDRAMSDSSKSAIDWLRKVLATESASGIVVSAVWGLATDSTIQLTDEVAVVPIAKLPDSPQKDSLSTQRIPDGMLGFAPQQMSPPPKAALVRAVSSNPFLIDLSKEETREKYGLESQSLLSHARSALTLVSSVPLVEAIHWFQFDDPDLEDASFFSGTGWMAQEIVPQRFEEGTPIDGDDARSVVVSFGKLDSDVRDRALISLARFNQALLRRMPGDKAVELSIALEALLVDDRGEHTHKVGMRAALLAGGSLESRVHNRSIVTALYSLRSALMHSGRVPNKVKVKGEGKQPTNEIVGEGTEIVRNVIRNIIETGELPNWYEVEISSGSGD